MNRIQAAQKIMEILDEAGFTTSLWTKEASLTASEDKVAVGVHVRVYVNKTKLDGRKGDDLGYVQVTNKVDVSRLYTSKAGLFNYTSTLEAIEINELEMSPAKVVAKAELEKMPVEKARVESSLSFGEPYATDEINRLKERALSLATEAINKGIPKNDYLPFVEAAICWLEACAERSAERDDMAGSFSTAYELTQYKKDLERLSSKH